jgi:hypothetical protein
MPLVKQTLNTGIQSSLQPLIDTRTNKAMVDALNAMLDVDLTSVVNTKDIRIKKAADAFSAEMKKLSEDIAKVVSDQVDTFVKSATIITPPGTAVTTTGSPTAQVGATIAPTAPAIIS